MGQHRASSISTRLSSDLVVVQCCEMQRVNHSDSHSNPKCRLNIEENKTESYKFSIDDWEEWVGIADSKMAIDTDIDNDVDTDSNNDDTDNIMDFEL